MDITTCTSHPSGLRLCKKFPFQKTPLPLTNILSQKIIGSMNVSNRYFTNYMVRYDQQLVAHTMGRSSKYFRQLKSLGGTVFQSNQMDYLPTTVTVHRPTTIFY
jgi:hypothetical protein